MAKSQRLSIAIALAAALLLAAFLAVRWAVRQRPRFYVHVLAGKQELQREAAQRFELQSIALHNALQHDGRWSLALSQEEINGWLAVELPEKFPALLPAGVSQPRICIAGHQVQVAVGLEQHGIATVVSLFGDVDLTTQPNEVAVRIERVRAGIVPMPLNKLLDLISTLAADSGLAIRWTEVEGDPVLLLKLPTEVNRRQLLLESLELADGNLLIAGRTEIWREESTQPLQQAERGAEGQTR